MLYVFCCLTDSKIFSVIGAQSNLIATERLYWFCIKKLLIKKILFAVDSVSRYDCQLCLHILKNLPASIAWQTQCRQAWRLYQ